MNFALPRQNDYRTAFPLPFQVSALDPFEAEFQDIDQSISWWRFLSPFAFVSVVWGRIEIPKGFYTDFASVPLHLQSIFQNDAPILLRPSAAHDYLFRPDRNGARGWLPDRSKQLTLREANEVLREAMKVCGADQWTCNLVFETVQLANLGIINEFAPPTIGELQANADLRASHRTMRPAPI